MGDSNTEGRVNNKYKTCSLLEEKLNKKFAASNINFEIINTGTSSYSTLIYYLLIKNYLIEYQPDMIFLNIDMTDIPNDSFYRNFLIKNSEGEILAITPQDNTKNIKYQLTPNGYKKIKINKFYNAILERSDFFYFLDRAISRWGWWGKLNIKNDIDRTYNEADWLNLNWNDEIEKNIYKSINVIKKIINLSKKNNIELVITGIPHLKQFTGEQSAHSSAAQAWLGSGLLELKRHPEVSINGSPKHQDRGTRPSTVISGTSMSTESSLSSPIELSSYIAQASAGPSRGSIILEDMGRNYYSTTVDVERESMLLLKVSYHPNWRATIDESEADPVMLMPGFTGIQLAPGEHKVTMEYRSRDLRKILLGLGLLILLSIGLLEKRSATVSAWIASRVFAGVPRFIKNDKNTRAGRRRRNRR